MKKIVFILILAVLSFSASLARTDAKFSYQAQKKLIPAELGQIYLGMPFKEFAKQVELKNAEIGDTRFEWLELSVPLEKGDIAKLTVRIQGLSEDDKKAILKRETFQKKDEFGDVYEEEVDRLAVEKIPAKGFVYAMYIDFKKDFDLKSYVIKTYGQDGEVRQTDDPYHFFDIQWTKKTPDKLIWLIRSLHEGDARSLQLLGRIDGTEWGLD